MNLTRTETPAQAALKPITSVPAGVRLLADVAALLDQLIDLVGRETELVRRGRLRDAASIEPTKGEVGSRYLAASRAVCASAAFLKANLPNDIARVEQRHRLLADLLLTNQMVLATAHAVAEGLIRGAAGEVERKRRPQGYGASGLAIASASRAAQPVVLSRTF